LERKQQRKPATGRFLPERAAALEVF